MSRSASSSTRARRAARALTLAGGLVLAAATPATAYIGGVGNGKQVNTVGPDLEAVQIVNADLIDPNPNVVRFCFDYPVKEVRVPTGFAVFSYDARRRMTSTAATDITPGNNRCVDAQFDNSQDIAEGTVAFVEAEAVADSFERRNVPATSPLSSSRIRPVAGRSTGPDLVNVTRNTTNGTATFEFDEQLSQASIPDTTPDTPANENNAAVARTFRFVQADGQTFGADEVLNGGAASGRFVTVRFAESEKVAQAQRWVYDGQENAFSPRDLPQSSGGSTYAPPGVIGGATSLPVIVRASRYNGSSREFRIEYSNEVNRGNPAALFAITDDARFARAQALDQQSGDNKAVIAQFDEDVVGDDGGVMRIVDLGGAIVSDSTPAIASALGQAVTGTLQQRAGFTAGPDLLGATLDKALHRITFRFDENLASEDDLPYDPTAFRGINRAGDVESDTNRGSIGTEVAVNGRSITVRFPSAIDNSNGAALRTGAVADRIFSAAPAGSVSFETVPAPAGPPQQQQPVTQPPTPTTPGPTPITTQRTRYVSRVTLKRSGSARRRKYSGRVRSEGRGCQSGRRVVIKLRTRSGRTRTITRTFTKGDGTFSLRRRKIGGGKVYAFVTERGGAEVFCRSAASQRITG